MASVLSFSESGRLDLPSDIRRAVGLERGGPVSVWVEGGEIHLGAVRDIMAALQTEACQIFSGSGESVAAFLEDRRDESDRDDRVS